MTNLRRALLVTVFAALGASTAIAQTNAPMAPMPFCPEGSVIIVDGARECQIADSLDKLIKEMEEAEIKGDPISAGSEGNELAYISRQTTFDTLDDYEAYAARLTELPRYFRQHRANMSRGIKTGMTASAEIMPGILDMVEARGR